MLMKNRHFKRTIDNETSVWLYTERLEAQALSSVSDPTTSGVKRGFMRTAASSTFLLFKWSNSLERWFKMPPSDSAIE